MYKKKNALEFNLIQFEIIHEIRIPAKNSDKFA